MRHGHFDRLGIMLYDKGSEILADYGAARFINVAAKEGGRYLDENKSWAKQSIAHNTIILNQKSHFDANLKKAEKTSPELVYADLENKDIQIVSASDDYCYPGVELNRTLCFMEQDGRKYLIDLFNIINEKTAVYDIPYYYQGQIIQTNFPYSRMKEYKVLGEKNGYQHLLVDTRAVSLPQTASITWMNGNGFYTLSSLSNPDTEFMITKLGANDPDFNLREQAGFMLRNRHAGNTKFLNVIEIHGNYNPESEAVLQSEGSIEKMELFSDEMARVMILLKLKNGKVLELFLDLKFTDSDENQIKINGEVKKWQGNYKLNIH